MDLTTAWSKGGKAGLAAPSGFVVKGEVACGPASPPVADGVRVKTDLLACLDMGQARLLMQEKYQRGPLA
jgi:hypothetical protein